jgi:hypothetical protein
MARSGLVAKFVTVGGLPMSETIGTASSDGAPIEVGRS